MQKLRRIVFLLVLSGFGLNAVAQTTILDQSMLTAASFNTFTAVNVTGTQAWYLNTTYGAMCNGYAGGQSFQNEDWLISPPMDLVQVDNVKLTFNHSRGSAAVVNVGVDQGWYKAFATADFTGDPATTQWVELTGLNLAVPAAWTFIPSGELVIPDNAKSATSRIAFRYMSSAAESATWEIKNVRVTGEPQGTSPGAGVFKITNWNVEWLGCTTFGPTDETLQVNNVVAAMQSMNSDLYCIQEVSNTVSSPSIATIVSLLGSDQWEGQIVPSTTGDCDQRQGIIYKKSRVQFVSATQLSSGSAEEGNSYYYNWASGRYPAVYNVNLVAGAALVPVSVVNIHAKAEDGNALSYTRRLGASEALKTILDGTGYNTKNLMVIGDFNDYLTGTSSSACGCTASPYQNFMDDPAHYNGITQSAVNAWGNGNPLIEHLVISDELFGNYVPNSVFQELAAAQGISNYYGTTSHHLPVSTTFSFPVLGSQQFTHENALAVYPNPAGDRLTFAGAGDNGVIGIYDVTGRQIRCETNGDTVDVSGLPSGIYVLKVGSRYGRFVKK
jgi:endonuclease/exonuclease/phosphatase family metal-dependent hydrolase